MSDVCDSLMERAARRTEWASRALAGAALDLDQSGGLPDGTAALLMGEADRAERLAEVIAEAIVDARATVPV